MAAFEALCTPRSAPLAAILPHSGAQTQRLLFPSSSSAELTDMSLSIFNDDSCSSDKENSPSRATEKHSQVCDTSVMNSLLHISPLKQHVSFTPQRVRPLPRAWERRPATPFVTRNDGQKIWKRVPLQELNVDPNLQSTNGEKEDKQNYTRITKKLRLDAENSFVTILGDVKAISAVGTKWEEENIENGGSPKKKLRRNITNPGDVSISCVGSVASKDLPAGQQASSGKAVLKPEMETNPTRAQESANGDGVRLAGHIEIELQCCHDQEKEDQMATEGGILNDPDANANAGVLSQITTMNTIELQADNVILAEVAKDELSTTTASSDEGTVLTTLEIDTSTLATEEVLTEAPATYSAAVAEPLKTSNQHPTSDALSEELQDSMVLPSGTAVMPTNAQAMLVFTGSDYEDTAFLRDFLERAQASRAAKITLSPQKKVAPSPFIDEAGDSDVKFDQPEDSESIDDIEDDDLSPPVETAKMEQMYVVDDLKVGSPTRRSARTSTRATSSRLPRYQVPTPYANTVALPGTIQLKRATGNEFIFNAKLQQTLAMTTRSNTKRNQCGSIHVPQRLAQLKKELEIRLQNETAPEMASEEDIKLALEKLDADADLENASKKRKRDKQGLEKLSKRRKSVRWPGDEDLARYREPSPTVNGPEASESLEETLQIVLLPTDTAQAETADSGTSHVESVDMSVTSEPKRKADPIEESSKHQVRRIRKIKLDSVNGTPAPKTRSRTISDTTTSSSTNEALSGDAAAAASKSSTRKSSRMPVPVSTSIPLPSFTTSKFKTRSSDHENGEKIKSGFSSSTTTKNSSSTATIASRTNLESTTKNAIVEPSEIEHKIDGRRRLRGRA